MDLENNPRYQRAIQIMRRYNPRQKAIFNTIAADRAFAATDMGKRIQLLKMGMAERSAKRDFAERKKDYKRAKKYGTIAELMGVGDIGLKTYFGTQDIKHKERIAQMINKDRKKLYPGAKLFF